MNQLIVITGLDGTGTSSVGEELAAQRDALLLHTPAEPFRKIRREIDLAPREESPAAHYLFYLASLVHADVKFIRPGLLTRDVVCVRHLVDTVVSHRAAGLDVDVNYETPVHDLRPPDWIFFLTVEESARQERLSGRCKYDHLDRALDDTSLRGRFIDEFGRLSHSMTAVDTTYSTASQVALAINTMLEAKE